MLVVAAMASEQSWKQLLGAHTHFQNIFIDPIVSARKKAEKRDRNEERGKERKRRFGVNAIFSDWWWRWRRNVSFFLSLSLSSFLSLFSAFFLALTIGSINYSASEQRRLWGDRHACEKVVPVPQHYGTTFPGHMTDLAPPWRYCCQLSKPQCTQHWSFPLTCRRQLHSCSPSVAPALMMHLIYHTADCGSSMALSCLIWHPHRIWPPPVKLGNTVCLIWPPPVKLGNAVCLIWPPPVKLGKPRLPNLASPLSN